MELELVLRKAANILFVVSPVATSLGSVLSVGIDGFMPALAPLLQEQTGIDFSQTSLAGWWGLSVFFCNLCALPFRKNLRKEVLKAIEVIENSDCSHLQKQAMYKKLFHEYISSVTLSQEMQSQLNNITRK